MDLRLRAAAVALPIVLLAACGSSSNSVTGREKSNGEAMKTGPEVARDASAALIEAGAVRVTGTGATPDFATGKSVEGTIEMHVQSDGGQVVFTAGGTSFEAVMVGGKAYLKFSGGSAKGLGALYGGKWIAADSSNDEGGDSELNIRTIGKELVMGDELGAIAPEVTTTTLDGEPAVLLRTAKGGQIWVAATGKPYPLQLMIPKSGTDGSTAAGTIQAPTGPATLRFSDFGKRIAIATPSPVVDPTAVPGLPR